MFSTRTICGGVVGGKRPKRCPACVAKVNNSRHRREYEERKRAIEANEFNKMMRHWRR